MEGEVREASKATKWLNTILLPFTLRTKITLPYFFLALLLIGATAYIATRIIYDTVEARFINQLVESGKLASEGMVAEENRLLETLRLLANTKGISEAMLNADSEALQELTFGVIVNNQEEAVEFLDPAGIYFLSVHHRKGGRIEEYEFSRGNQVDTNAEFIRKVLDHSSDRLGDKFSGVIRSEMGSTFYVAGPVFDASRKMVGVVMVGTTLEKLVQKLREETLAQVSLYDINGRVLASTFVDPQGLPITRVYEILENQDHSSASRDYNREVEVRQIHYEEILGPWEGRGDQDLGILGTALTRSFLINATRLTRAQASTLGVLALLVVVLVGIVLSGLITDPIRKLVWASQQIASGDLDVRLQPTTRDELSTLMKSFNLMVEKLRLSSESLINSYDSTLEGWSKALELRDQDTEGHTLRVTDLTLKIARAMGLSEGYLIQVKRGALLHDIGKMGVPDAILKKKGKLTDEEQKIMQLHPLYAYNMLKGIEYLEPALEIPFCHHEWWDGSGYPRGLKGEEIPLVARIFAVADVWDALRSERSYRKAISEQEAMESIRSESGTHFDPQVLQVFMDLYEKGEI